MTDRRPEIGPASRIVVVGASAAGLSTVEGLRRLGFTGRLTLLGEEHHPPYDRPPLSKQVLRGQWDTERLRLRPAETLAALDLDLRLGTRATALDTGGRQVVLADGERIGYDALVIATGLSARRLPGTRGVAGVHTLRTLDDALALRATLAGAPRLVVVGAGFIGTEAAAVARATGAPVTLVSRSPVLLADVLGRELGTLLTQAHRENGVRVVSGAPVREVLADGGRVGGVVLADGRRLAADAVLVGIGAVPNTAWLAGSGVPVDDGVLCDAGLYAGRGVWAAGDVARWRAADGGRARRVEHRTNAAEQGAAVARDILAGPGGSVPFTPVPFAWTDQYDLRVQIYGQTRGAERIRVVEGDTASRAAVAVYGAGGRVSGVAGVNLPRATRAYRALVARGAELSELDARPGEAAPASAGVRPRHGDGTRAAGTT